MTSIGIEIFKDFIQMSEDKDGTTLTFVVLSLVYWR